MLHKLPKDLLVKLVATIREDTKKKYMDLLKQCAGSTHHFCREKTCDAFAITSECEWEDGEIFNSHNRKFRACSMCQASFCEIHDSIMECVSCKKLLCFLCYEKYEKKYFRKVEKNCAICKKDITVICRYCDKDVIECSECKKDED